MFKNAMLVAALVDRLTYHSHILNMNGESYRFQNVRRRYAQSGSEIHGHVVHFFIDIHTFESIDRFPTPKKTAYAVLFGFCHYSQAGTMVPLYFSAMNFLTDSD